MYEKYISEAINLGAVDCVAFDISQIVFDPRTILKCKYGCTDYGKLHNCPSDPKSLNILDSIEIFKHYKNGVLIHAHDKYVSQKVSFEIERLAFLDGFHFALSLSDCGLCKECRGICGEPCANVRMARPALHSVGIDVYTTAKNFGLPLYPLKGQNEEQNWYSAVFIE
ncbi:MAG: DUF2284 domain-containing protein [Clostridia bacterium]|nr:DUF2284 domain-containing protein [Clostridia bacterium]